MSSNIFAANVYYAGNVIVSQSLNVSAITSTVVASGQVQSLDSVRAHALPSDAMIFASGTKVQPANQNLGSYSINDQVSGSTPTINGSVPAVTQSPFADLYKEGSVYIDGVAADYISTSLTGYTMSQGISMEMFVNYVNFTNSTYTIGFMAASAATYNFTLGVNASAAPIVTWTGGTLVSSVTVSANTWNHLACSWDGTTLRLYVNGALGNSTTSFTPPTLAQNFLIGRANSLTCTAYVTDVRIVTNPAVYVASTLTVPSAPLSPASAGTTNFMLRVGSNSPTVQNGALTFDRGLKQFMNFGPQTFNIVTQGFTAVWRGQFTGTPGNYETIFQAGLASTNNGALFLGRAATGQSIIGWISASSGTSSVSTISASTTIVQGTTYIVAWRYNPVTQIHDIWVNGVQAGSASLLTSTLVADRLLPTTYVGVPYSAQQYLSASSNTLAVYNRALSNVEILNAYSALTTSTVNAPIEIGDSNGTPALSIAGDGRVNVTKLGQSSNVVPWPPSAMSGYVTSINGGTYVASASGEYIYLGVSGYSWQLFDKGGTYWQSGNAGSAGTGYNTSSPFNYTGNLATTDVNGTVYKGEWVQIQLPSPVLLSSYTLVPYIAGCPQIWAILGSRDGVNWFLVNQQSLTVTNNTLGTFSANPTSSYSYYRMVITQLQSTNINGPNINEWTLFGTADTAQPLTVSQPVTLSYGAQTASLTGIAGSAFVPQDFSSSGLNIPAYVVSNTATVANTVAYSSFGPFAGEGSLYFPGGFGAYVQFPPSAITLWPGGGTLTDGTIEMWVYITQFNSSNSMFFNRGTPAGASPWYLAINSSGLPYFAFNNGSGTTVGAASSLTTNSWNHIAVTVKSNIITVFLNGVPGTTGTFSGTLTGSSTYSLYMSNYQNGSAQTIYGYTACARIVSGAALYTGNFTPPSAPLQPIQGVTQSNSPYGTVLLLRNAPAPGRVLTSKFGGANSGQVLAFPPAAMTTYAVSLNSGYGQGTYVASASSEYPSVNQNYAWMAFDKTSAYQWGCGNALYTGGPPGTAGASTARTVDVTGAVYQGEWVQLQMPVSIVLSSYTINGYSTNNGPYTWYLLGSRDGTNWSLVDARSGITWSGTYIQTFNVGSASQAFNYYRYIIYQIGGAGGSANPVVAEITYNGTIEGLALTQDGRLGLGVSAPVQALEVAGSAVVAGTLSAGNPLMFRNRIINGDFRVDQRGSASTPVAAAMNSYSSDRWQQEWVVTSGAMTAGQVALTASEAPYQYGFRYANKWTVTTAINLAGSGGGNYVLPKQIIEGYNIADLNWGTPYASPITVSFWFRGFAGGSYANAVRVGGGGYTTYNSLFSVNANTWTYVTYTVPPPPSGAAPTSTTTGAGIELYIANYNAYSPAAAPNTWTGNFPYQATQGALNWYSTLGNYVLVTGVQLEKGSVATPFEVRPYATELALCQRYYWAMTSGVTVKMHPDSDVATSRFLTIGLPVYQRANPTQAATVSSGSGSLYGGSLSQFAWQSTGVAATASVDLSVATSNAEL